MVRPFPTARATVAGPSIWTGTGYLDLLNPCPADIDLGDIARGLSNLCRYTGLCETFYSVAEHSVHAADLARRDRQPVEVQRAVLMHDAAEAYLGDVSRPLKKLLPDYAHLERRMGEAIAERFGLPADDHRQHMIVKIYDDEMLAHEKDELCPGAGDWPGTAIPLRTRAPRALGWRPHVARAAFLAAAANLGVR